MRKVKEILRQKLSLGRSHREVARSVGVSPSVVSEAAGRARALGLAWADVDPMTEDALDERLFGPRLSPRAARPLPDPAYIHAELRRVGVTLQLLHLEYLEQHPAGYRYTAFCEHYTRWLSHRSPTMRQVHKAGDKLFVDYSGKKPHIVDRGTGEVVDVELFVAVLGASNLTYADATRTQRIADWCASHVRALVYIGGVPRALVPDQLKSGVTKACRYEPAIQRSYDELAEHYGTAVLPARPADPRGKAKVEVGVQIAQRWILARLRNQSFFSIEELNERIAELLEDLNARRMRVYGCSRRELFERVEKGALGPLPETRFTHGDWKLNRAVNIDYHVEFDHHYYSVLYTYRCEDVRMDVRATSSTVEIYTARNNEHVATHARSYVRGRHTTKPEHMPKAHQQHLDWTPTRIIHWASGIGPSTAALAEAILADRPHPEQGYRSCLGILRLEKRYGRARLEAACARSVAVGARSYRHVDAILVRGLDRLPLDDVPAPSATPATPIAHENVRGRDYYN